MGFSAAADGDDNLDAVARGDGNIAVTAARHDFAVQFYGDPLSSKPAFFDEVTNTYERWNAHMCAVDDDMDR